MKLCLMEKLGLSTDEIDKGTRMTIVRQQEDAVDRCGARAEKRAGVGCGETVRQSADSRGVDGLVAIRPRPDAVLLCNWSTLSTTDRGRLLEPKCAHGQRSFAQHRHLSLFLYSLAMGRKVTSHKGSQHYADKATLSASNDNP